MSLSSSELVALPLGFCSTPSHLILFADRHRILSYDDKAGFSHFAGSLDAGYADGDRLNARFTNIRGLCASSDGSTIYVSDSGNQRIRKIDLKGVVTTYAGTGLPGRENGERLASTFSSPAGLHMKKNGDLVVADSGNHIVRLITSAGNVSTLAGDGLAANFRGPFDSASILSPQVIRAGFYGELIVTSTLSASGSSIITLLHPDGMAVTRDLRNTTIPTLEVIPCPSSSSYFCVRAPADVEPKGTVYLLEEDALIGEWSTRFQETPTTNLLATLVPKCRAPRNSTSTTDSTSSTSSPSTSSSLNPQSTRDTNDTTFLYELSAVKPFLDAIVACFVLDSYAFELSIHMANEGVMEHEEREIFVCPVDPAATVAELVAWYVEKRFAHNTPEYGLIAPNGRLMPNDALLETIVRKYSEEIGDPCRHPLFVVGPKVKDITVQKRNMDGEPVENIGLYTVPDGLTFSKLRHLIAINTGTPASSICIYTYSDIRYTSSIEFCGTQALVFDVDTADAEKCAQVTVFPGHRWDDVRDKIAATLGLAESKRYRIARRYRGCLEASPMSYNRVSEVRIQDLSSLVVQESPLIPLFIRTLTGMVKTVNIPLDATGLELKVRIEEMLNTTADRIRLIFAGRILEDTKCLYEYNIQPESTIMTILRL